MDPRTGKKAPKKDKAKKAAKPAEDTKRQEGKRPEKK